MTPYEITFIVRPDLDDEQMRGAADQVNRRLETAGGRIVASYPWGPGRRRMAYPIRNFGEGFYVTTVFEIDPSALRELENGLRLNESVLRFLLVQATDLQIRNAQQRMQQATAPPPAPAPAAPVRAPEPVAAAVAEAPETAQAPATPAPPESTPETAAVSPAEAPAAEATPAEAAPAEVAAAEATASAGQPSTATRGTRRARREPVSEELSVEAAPAPAAGSAPTPSMEPAPAELVEAPPAAEAEAPSEETLEPVQSGAHPVPRPEE